MENRPKKPGTLFVSDPINVLKFRDEWQEIFEKHKLNEDETSEEISENQTKPRKKQATGPVLPKNTLSSLIGLPVKLPQDLYKELAQTCGVTTLLCDGEPPIYEFASKRLAAGGQALHNVPKEVGLITLKLQKEDLIKRWNDPNYRAVLHRRSKHVNLDKKFPEINLDTKTEHLRHCVDETEVLMSVMVCRPSHGYVKRCMIKGGVKFNVLGTQKLTELRDKISCVADIMVPGDFSSNPMAPADIRAKDLYKSGFFFINGVFYNDMRDLTCRDYSKPIMEWATNSCRKMGPFQSKKMEDTQFLDLDVQLGYPYVYIHQGDCEHIIVFTDLRMVNGSDSLDKDQYPICCWVRKKKRTSCMVCHSNTAKWVVQKNARLPTDPFFFCDFCFRGFNYDSQSQKIGEFIAQPYLDKVAML